MEVEVKQLSHEDGIFKQLPTAGQSFPISLSGKTKLAEIVAEKLSHNCHRKWKHLRTWQTRGKGLKPISHRARAFKAPRNITLKRALQWFVGHAE